MAPSNKTKKEYARILKKYSEYDVNDPIKIFNSLVILSRKNNLSIGSIKQTMCAFKYEYNEDCGPLDEVNQKYRDIIFGLIKISKVKEESGTNKFKKVEWENIINKINDDTLSPLDAMITAIYVLLPPRRLNDYLYMRYTVKPNKTYDTNFNYYVRSTGQFIFNNYKTSKTYGIQTFPINSQLKKIIDNYIDMNSISNKKLLLNISKATLSRKLENIFGVSVCGLRHSFISHLYQDANNLFDIKKISQMMGHNVQTHLNYLDRDNIKIKK